MMKYLLFLIIVVSTTIPPARFAIIDMNGDRREVFLEFETLTPETVVDLKRIVPLTVPESAFPATATVLELRDGSRIVAEDVRMTAPAVTFRSQNASMQIALDQVAAMRFGVAREQEVQHPHPDWVRLAQLRQATGDRLVVQSFDHHEGIVEEIDTEIVQFRMDGDLLPVRRDRVFGILFHLVRPERTFWPDAIAQLTETGGSLYFLSDFAVEGDHLTWQTPGGLAGTTPLAAIRELDLSQANSLDLTLVAPDVWIRSPTAVWANDNEQRSPIIQLLSDLSRNRFEQFSSPEFSDFSDDNAPRSTSDTRRREPPQHPIPPVPGTILDGQTYAHALAFPAKTVAEYRLTEPYTSFRAIAGIDDRFRPWGQVRLTICGDGRLLYDEIIPGDRPAVRLNLDITGIQTLTITADFPNGPIPGSRLLLANPQLIK